jgi:acyl-CoA synthetase (AMP-forming)/AMP-acid ligase II
LTLGYLDDPERTADAFRGGWFHSGFFFVDSLPKNPSGKLLKTRAARTFRR